MTRMNERTARPEVAPYLGRARWFGFAYFACFAGNPCFIRVPSVAKVGLPFAAAGGRVFFPCQQDGWRGKPRRAFSKVALGQGHIKFLTVRNLILAGSVPRKGLIRNSRNQVGNFGHGLNTDGPRIAEEAKVRGSRSSPLRSYGRSP